MKEKILELAKKKGFDYISYVDDLIQTQNLSHQFLLLQLQKWLREEHDLHIMICPKRLLDDEGTVKYYIFEGKIKKNWNNLYDTYEKALEQALKNGLKTIEEVK